MSHDFLVIFVLIIHHLVVLVSSLHFSPSREYFVCEYLEALSPSWTILLAVEFVLFEIKYIRDGRPVIPIFEHKLVAEAHRYSC